MITIPIKDHKGFIIMETKIKALWKKECNKFKKSKDPESKYLSLGKMSAYSEVLNLLDEGKRQ